MTARTRWKKLADEQREAEMARGQAVLAQRALSARFNPEHDDWASKSEGAKEPDRETREYQARMRAANKERWGD